MGGENVWRFAYCNSIKRAGKFFCFDVESIAVTDTSSNQCASSIKRSDSGERKNVSH
jgi:hypothetical protein